MKASMMPDNPIAPQRGTLRNAAGSPSLRLAVGLLLLWCMLLALFHRYPALDIAASGAFFTVDPCPPSVAAGKICGHFLYAGQSLFVFLRKIFFYLPAAAAVVLIVLLIARLQHHGATFDAKGTRRISLLLVALALGPYALVNLVLKEFSDRPRPYQTDLFGGTMPFVPAGSFDGLCDSNCSFVSGEAAGAGWLICLMILVPRRYRLVLAPPIIASSLVTPALRLAFGGHYLSDTVLGFLIAPLVTAAIFAVAEMRRARKKAQS